jgi:hypothetical protein
MTEKQAKLLAMLPVGEWIHYSQLPARSNIGSLNSLHHEGAILLVAAIRPDTITDKEFEQGWHTVELREYDGTSPGYPHWIKRLQNVIPKTPAEELVALKERIEMLEKKLEDRP